MVPDLRVTGEGRGQNFRVAAEARAIIDCGKGWAWVKLRRDQGLDS
jgi:hypothetical protein